MPEEVPVEQVPVEQVPVEQVPVEQYAESLAGAIEAAIPGWITASVSRVMMAWKGEVPAEVERATAEAAQQARDDAGRQVRELLARDIDEQRATPLSILRSAVRFPTEVLHAAGVPPVERDAFRAQAFPGDVYDLAPASFADVDPGLNDVAMAWGAAKAMAHRRRHGNPSGATCAPKSGAQVALEAPPADRAAEPEPLHRRPDDP